MWRAGLLGLLALTGCANACGERTSSSGRSGSVSCPYGVEADGGRMATYDKGCRSDDDCAIGGQLLDCCGSSIAIGINRSERARLDAEGGLCGARATCKCKAMPMRAEDGRNTRDSASYPPRDVAVACVAGACTTRIRDDWTPPTAAPDRPPGARSARPPT